MANATKQLRNENNALDRKLNEENNRILTDMVVDLHSFDLSEYDVQVIRKELSGMAIESQQRGDAFSTVIGGDYRAFCDELVENGRKKSFYERSLEFFYIIVYGCGALLLFEVVRNALKILLVLMVSALRPCSGQLAWALCS